MTYLRAARCLAAAVYIKVHHCPDQQETFMTQSGQIVGDVEFRPGDGARMPIPRGRVDIETSQTEATLSWADGDTHGAAAIPLTEFKRYVSEGAIKLNC